MMTILLTAAMLGFGALQQAEAVQDAAAVEAVEAYGPYFVFFGFDSSAIDRDGNDILRQVADDYRASGATALIVTGHTDRSGASDYNRRLSKRRVDAVRSRLVELGVAGSAITVGPDGEGQPLIETADGVREAQNRRVEIHFE